MADYAWDLAYSFDHRPKADGTYDLQLGLLKYDEAAKKWFPASPVGLKKDDRFKFSLFDLTKTGNWTTTKVSAVVIEFSAAINGGRNTPCGDMEVVLVPSFDHIGASNSGYFGGPHTAFNSPEWWTIQNDGGVLHCEMTVTVYVTKKAGSKHAESRKFIVDPEMIIDSQAL